MSEEKASRSSELPKEDETCPTPKLAKNLEVKLKESEAAGKVDKSKPDVQSRETSETSKGQKKASTTSELSENDETETSFTPKSAENIDFQLKESKIADKSQVPKAEVQSSETGEVSEEQENLSKKNSELPEEDTTSSTAELVEGIQRKHSWEAYHSKMKIKEPETTDMTFSEMYKSYVQSSETEFASMMNVSPTSDQDSPPLEGAVGYSSSPLSDSIDDKFNNIGRTLDRCRLHPGKLVVFQRFLDMPTLDFFVRPQNRRRHNAARNAAPTEPQNVDPNEAIRSFVEFLRTNSPIYHYSSSQPPRDGQFLRATVNQAGAVIGPPQYIPSVKELLEDESFTNSPPGRSLGSSSTVPIHEIYAEDSFSPSNLRFYNADGTITTVLKVSDNSSDSSTGSRQREIMFGITQPVDIPDRRSGYASQSAGRYQEFRSREFFRNSPSDSVSDTSDIPKRKISQDSSGDGTESHRLFSVESSVDLDRYMTAEQTLNIDDVADLPIPDMFLTDSFGVQDRNPEVAASSEGNITELSSTRDLSPTSINTESNPLETSKGEAAE